MLPKYTHTFTHTLVIKTSGSEKWHPIFNVWTNGIFQRCVHSEAQYYVCKRQLNFVKTTKMSVCSRERKIFISWHHQGKMWKIWYERNKNAQILPPHSSKLYKHLQNFSSSINMSLEQPAHTDLGAYTCQNIP